ncbi:YegP family protein [Rhizobium sp. NTR19]|uniref:YegP family protein n=1 Tax=Neorhizobium turbinariae TaxID=2937795 RepID=A0ABT0IXP1_9HYPH|nr:YegP family protein [Neorhizobium turbinariae]MCK8782620.1 YegP family protein [Neorhizobium turbinariae]
MATCKETNGDTWEIYQSSGEWRWRRKASNGKIVGQSSEGYNNKSDCIANARRNGMTCNPV